MDFKVNIIKWIYSMRGLVRVDTESCARQSSLCLSSMYNVDVSWIKKEQKGEPEKNDFHVSCFPLLGTIHVSVSFSFFSSCATCTEKHDPPSRSLPWFCLNKMTRLPRQSFLTRFQRNISRLPPKPYQTTNGTWIETSLTRRVAYL